MDFYGSLTSLVMGALTYGIPFLFVLTIVVFIHELGHFQVARWCGVAVKTFSIGFGRELFGWTDRHGTRWRIAAVPLGGYVKFVGDENAASAPDHDGLARMSAAERARSFQAQSVGRRALIVAAGPFANFILATAIFAAVYGSEGKTIVLPYVGEVTRDSAAEAAGLKTGDRILAIEGRRIENFMDIVRHVAGNAERPLAVEIDRGGEVRTLVVTPRMSAQETSLGVQRRGMLGIQRSQDPAHQMQKAFTPLEAVGEGVKQNWVIAEQTFGFFARLVTGREHLDQLSGIGRIAQASGETAKLGFVALLIWLAYISTSIGILNLLPIPMLDGGHLVFCTLEAVRGRPLSDRAQEIGFRIGLAVVLALMVVANWNDVLHFAAKLG